MKFFLFILGCFYACIASAQLKFEGFNAGMPSNWKTTTGSELSLSSEHFKGGNQALKWAAKKGASLIISDLSIPAKDIGDLKANAAQFFIYNKAATNDTLVFQFIDSKGVVKRQGKMLLSFEGWRDYHRSYRYDYDKGRELPEFELNQCRIVYKPADKKSSVIIYFDEMLFVGDSDRRFPGPHMILDARHFHQTASTAGGDSKRNLINWAKGPDIPVSPATADELAALTKIRAAFSPSVPSVSAAALKAAKDYVSNSFISRNPDKSIKGRAIVSLVNQDTLLMLSRYCGSLARAYLRNKDMDAKDKLILFTEYLLDQGLAEGGRNVITSNTYNEAREFPIGFLQALPIYSPAMRAEVIKMLKWSVEYSTIYTPEFIVRLNIDYIHVKSNFLFEIALADPSPDVSVRDLKCIKRFLELNTDPGDGGRDGIKPDGVGVHHQSHHMSYLYSFGTWIERAYLLKGTPFRISRQAYDNMSFAIKSLFLETSRGTIYSHAASGRKPFARVPVKKASVVKLIEIGGDLINANFEPDLAAFYNYMFEQKYPVKTPALDGFYQFNYAQLGVLRKGNWVATMKGFTDNLFGAEIYKDQNVYGRYQSYGTLEVLYNGSLPETGYISNGTGWDWNVIPGTTTVHLPYSELRPKGNGTRTEFQGAAFAGALSLGKDGIFGMDFVQNPGFRYTSNELTFRKSVFAFDDFMVCLGSNINAKDGGNVATNLFQAINQDENPPIFVNSASAIKDESFTTSLSASSESVWLINAQTTGFYIPKGNAEISVVREFQTSPLNTSFNGKSTASAHASKAWISHGSNPNNAAYHYVTVPAVRPSRMKVLSKDFSNGSIYEVLKQNSSVHAVKYLPGNLTSYVFFEAQTGVDIGYVSGISNKALLGIRESSDSLVIRIANPDLNTVPVSELTSKWESTPSPVKLQLKGKWKIVENASNTSILKQGDSTFLTFILKQGFPAEVVLKRDVN